MIPRIVRVCLRACVCASNQPGNKLYDNAYFVFVCRNTTERNKNQRQPKMPLRRMYTVYIEYIHSNSPCLLQTPIWHYVASHQTTMRHFTARRTSSSSNMQYKFSASKNQHERSYLLHSFFFWQACKENVLNTSLHIMIFRFHFNKILSNSPAICRESLQ